jgi:formylglycine-generating enzyme required for sulfatase activity
MAVIPGGPFHFSVQFRIRECGWYESTPDLIKDFGKLDSLASRESDVLLAPYAMDLTPVTNAQFAQFLKASGYEPKQKTNFLKHWSNGAPPAGKENHPVVYVDLDDARAYAQWAGKRLPTQAEWQFAGQSADGRKFPWGNEAPKPDDELCNGFGSDTTPVKQFPGGRSPFGLYDLCGNTWEWTESERSDGANRFAILCGGSHYQAKGSHWYMDGGPREVSFAVKYLLAWPGLNRCATVGFRCAADLES